MLQVYETNGLSDSKRNDVPEKTICVILIPSSDVMLIVYAVIMPFLCCTAGESQVIDSEVELSAMIMKFWGAPLGTAKMKIKILFSFHYTTNVDISYVKWESSNTNWHIIVPIYSTHTYRLNPTL